MQPAHTARHWEGSRGERVAGDGLDQPAGTVPAVGASVEYYLNGDPRTGAGPGVFAVSGSKPRLYCYELPGAWTVLAGATDEDNDYVSTELAVPGDWWFHAEGVSGSHVILRARPGEDPGRDTIEQAAAVAAYHSKSRGAGMVRVYCTRARNVTKPRGAKVGTVQVTKGKVLKVRPDISAANRIPGGAPS